MVHCPNLLLPNWRIDRGLGWPNVVEPYSLTEYSAASVVLNVFREMYDRDDLYFLPPQPFWKFGVFLWSNQTNGELGLLPGGELGELFDDEDFDFVEFMRDEYYINWYGLLTEADERWAMRYLDY